MTRARTRGFRPRTQKGATPGAGRFVVWSRDATLCERRIHLAVPGESSSLGTNPLCGAFEFAAVLEAHGPPITDGHRRAPTGRWTQKLGASKPRRADREAWQWIGALFGDDEATYRQVCVLPVLVHRIVPFDFFRNGFGHAGRVYDTFPLEAGVDTFPLPARHARPLTQNRMRIFPFFLLGLALGTGAPWPSAVALADDSGPVPGLGETTASPMRKADDPNLPGRVERKRKKAAYDEWASTLTGGDWRHFTLSGFWALLGNNGSIASVGLQWDPLLYETLDRSIGLRLLAGVLGSRRLDDKSLYPTVEAGILASNRISSRWRLEIGPLAQWWLTRGESVYPGVMLQVALEFAQGNFIDRLGFSVQPTLVKGVLAQLWRLSIGFPL